MALLPNRDQVSAMCALVAGLDDAVPNTSYPDQLIRPSGLGRRIVAYIIDIAVSWCLLFLIGITGFILDPEKASSTGVSQEEAIQRLALAMSESSETASRSEELARSIMHVSSISLAVIAFFVFIFYRPILESWKGYTLGKYTMKIRVISRDGSKAKPLQCLIRFVLLLVDTIGFIVPIGFIVASCSKKRRRIGDMVARTLVVYDPL